MERYEDLMAYLGDLYVKLQTKERDCESKYASLIEGLRKQLQEKSEFIRKLEEDYSKLEFEILRLKDGMGNTGKDNS